MKKTLLAAMTALFIITLSVNVFAEVKTIKIKTSAVCEECEKRIETAVKELTGVLKADLDLETKIATVKYDNSKTNPDRIRKGISYAGYQADNVKAYKKAYNKLPDRCKGLSASGKTNLKNSKCKRDRTKDKTCKQKKKACCGGGKK